MSEHEHGHEHPTIEEITELMRDTFGDKTVVATNGNRDDPAEHEYTVEPVLFESLREFLQRELPPSESLMGVTRDGTNLLPRFGWVMPWGREGSGKTSVIVDLLFHAAAGLDWLVYSVERPMRIVCVVNEGIPGGLQDKLAQKIERWEGDVDLVLDNLAIYVSPWGEFTFRDAEIVGHARDFCVDFGADYVALDPLHTLGTSGSGSPAETEEFKHVLRRFGLWEDLGVITAHHSNKTGMVSGDWARHPDTVIHLEKDGPHPATKLTLQKARPADPHELGVPVLLKWLVESLSYEREEIVKQQPVDVEKTIAQALDLLAQSDEPMALDPLVRQVDGTAKRVRDVLLQAISDGLIINVATQNKSAKRKTYRLVLPEDANNVETRETVPTLFDGDAPQDGMVEPENNVDDAPTLSDVIPESPAEAKTTSTVSPPVRGETVLDVVERADDDADSEPPANPLL